jgi:hypothetical protein
MNQLFEFFVFYQVESELFLDFLAFHQKFILKHITTIVISVLSSKFL